MHFSSPCESLLITLKTWKLTWNSRGIHTTVLLIWTQFWSRVLYTLFVWKPRSQGLKLVMFHICEKAYKDQRNTFGKNTIFKRSEWIMIRIYHQYKKRFQKKTKLYLITVHSPYIQVCALHPKLSKKITSYLIFRRVFLWILLRKVHHRFSVKANKET